MCKKKVKEKGKEMDQKRKRGREGKRENIFGRQLKKNESKQKVLGIGLPQNLSNKESKSNYCFKGGVERGLAIYARWEEASRKLPQKRT